MMRKQIETETRAEDVVTEQTCLTRLRQSLFENFVRFENFTVDVVVAARNAHGVGRDGHAFNQCVWIVTNDVAVFECARLTFVGVTYQIFLPRILAWHKAPFEPSRETRTATATQSRQFHFIDDVVWRGFLCQDFFQYVITTARHIAVQIPVGSV